MYHIFFILSFADGHVDCFYVLAILVIVNKIAMKKKKKNPLSDFKLSIKNVKARYLTVQNLMSRDKITKF